MTAPTVAKVAQSVRIAVLAAGVIAIAFGIAVLAWPSKTAAAVTGVVAVYAIVAGIVYVAIGFLGSSYGTASRIGHALLGLLFIVAGIYAFTSLEESAAYLAVFVTIMIGIMWMVEGFTALFTLGEAVSTGWTIVFAIISILAGLSLVSMPVWGAGFLWWLVGIALVVLGVLNVIRGLSWKV